MTCNCKTEIEAKVVERLKEEYPEGRDHTATMDNNYAFLFSMNDEMNSVLHVGYIAFKNTVTTTTKKGVERTAKPQLNIHFTYCPFCGERYKKAETSVEQTEESTQ
jgi:hypothetical protein